MAEERRAGGATPSHWRSEFATAGADAKYELRYSQNWGECLISGITGSCVGDDAVSLWADCPRCEHQLSDVIFVEGANKRNGHRVETVISCNCQSGHEGRPEGHSGCGAYSGFTIILGTNATFHQAIATAEDRRWDEQAYKAGTTALAGARGLAEKWSATVATLLSLVGVAAILGLVEQLVELPEAWRWVAAGSTVLTVGLAAWATYLAAGAAQGRLKWLDEVTGKKLRDEEKTTLTRIASDLDKSRRFTAGAVAVATAVVVLVILVQGEEEEAPVSLLVVSDQAPEPLCGTPTTGRVGQLTLQPGDENAKPIPLSVDEIVTVTTVEECPDIE